MKKFLIVRVALILMIFIFSCQSKKAELTKKLMIVACQDTKDMVNNYANTIVPIIGKVIMEYAVPEEVEKGLLCDCITPSIQQTFIQTYSETELETMLIDKKARSKAIKKAITEKSNEILKCYKDKGFKGYKLIEGFFKHLLK